MTKINTSEVTPSKLNTYLQFAINISTNIGHSLMKSWGASKLISVSAIDNKGLLTQQDIESDTYIKERIAEEFPNHSYLTEESGASGSSPLRWVVDGLDGTNNYRRGDPNFSISLALQNNQQGIVGVVYAPAFNSLYFASKGGGAFVTESGVTRGIHVSTPDSLNMFTMSFAVGIDFHNPKVYDRIVAEIRSYNKIKNFRRRMLESTALELCYVACGKTDAHMNNYLKLWDYAAGEVIVREAGGKANYVGGQVLLASNGVIHKDLENEISRSLSN